MRQKSAPYFGGALFCCATNALINNFNKVRLTRADHPLGVRKAVHVNCDPASVDEHEVRIPDQSEMVRPISLNEELFRVPAKTEHFGVTRSELVLVHSRRLVRVHVRLACARTCPRLIPVYARLILVYVPSATLNIRLSTRICARLRLRLWLGRLLLLRGAHFLSFCRRSSLRFLRLSLRCRLLLVRCCLAYGHERQCQRRYRC